MSHTLNHLLETIRIFYITISIQLNLIEKYIYLILQSYLTFWSSPWLNLINFIILLLIIWIILDYNGFQRPEPIENIIQIPGYPIVGNLFQILLNPAQTYLRWSQEYNTPIFQIRLGIKNVIIVNSFKDVYSLWIKHSCANNSRPTSYTFHGIVSSTQGFTVGSTPAGSSYKVKKKVIAQYLHHKAIDEVKWLIDDESKYMIRKVIGNNYEISGPPSSYMHGHMRSELSDIDLMEPLQLFDLRSSIILAYGITLDCYNNDKEFSDEIIDVENQIIQLRSPVGNLQDFLPILRYLPFKNNLAAQLRQRRDKYMNKLMSILESKLKDGDPTAIESIVGRIKLNQDLVPVNEEQLHSICLTLVSAGLDNTPLNFNHLIGHFSQPGYGQALQEKAYNKILELSNNDLLLAWNEAVDTKCDYLMALIHESLRFFTVLPLALPRITTKPINYNQGEIIIPPNTILFMNAYAANHDPKQFEDPYKFEPERWLDPNGKLKITNELSHFAFGAGSRMCSGNVLAIQGIYTLMCRMILYFKIKPPIKDLMELDPFKNNSNPRATSFEPKVFKIRLEPRNHMDQDKLYQKIMS
ncbi:cytochrome P450 [Scheffersomyces coipomensis]|uniref:cytochrome P450 n=1 Tax=Scheffersomyces coipomensis TaxID=1788519 RepID=UPI00315C9BD2